MIQILDHHRIWRNRHLRGLNLCPAAFPLLLVTLGMTLTDLHAYQEDRLYIFRGVRARMLNASGMTLVDLHAYSDPTCFETCVHGCSLSQAMCCKAYPGLGNRSIFDPGSSVGSTITFGIVEDTSSNPTSNNFFSKNSLRVRLITNMSPWVPRIWIEVWIGTYERIRRPVN